MSLLQDKALRAARHCGPCSPLLGSVSSECLLTERTRSPLHGNIEHLEHITHIPIRDGYFYDYKMLRSYINEHNNSHSLCATI